MELLLSFWFLDFYFISDKILPKNFYSSALIELFLVIFMRAEIAIFSFKFEDSYYLEDGIIIIRSLDRELSWYFKPENFIGIKSEYTSFNDENKE